MRIYLDNCCLQRPFDDQTQPRIRVETEAVLVILAAVQAGEQILLNSEALEFEISRIPDSARRTESLDLLSLAEERFEIDDAVEALAQQFEAQGVSPLDAIHLALASEANADVFCTCDDKLWRKAQTLSPLVCRVTTILALVPEVTQ